MIYVNEDQLNIVEYLIDQSVQGNHILFESSRVREIFQMGELQDFQEEDAYAVEHHIENIISCDGLDQKRAYLEQLDTQTYEMVVRTYFNIIENNIFESSEVTH